MTLSAEDMELFKDLRMAEFGRVIQEIIDDPDRDHDSFEDKVKEALYAQRNARDSRRREVDEGGVSAAICCGLGAF